MNPYLFATPHAARKYALRRPMSRRRIWLAVTAAVGVGVGIVFPVVGIVLLALILATAAAASIMRRPANGLIIALGIFPFYPSLRGLITVWNLPIPTAGLRFWPELILLLVFASAMIHNMRQQRRFRLRLPDDWPAILWMAFGLYGAVLSGMTQHPLFTIFGLHYALLPPLFYFAVRASRPTEAETSRILRVLFMVYSAFALVSLAEFALHPNITLRLADAARPELRGVTGAADPLLFWRLYARMQSLLWEENVWGSLSSLVSLLALSRLVYERPSARQWFLILLSTFCLFLSTSRGSIGGWAVGIVILLLARGRYPERLRVVLGIAAVFLAGAYVLLAGDARVQMLTNAAGRTGLQRGRFGDDRWHQWERGIDIFTRNPSGTGIGTVGYGASNTGIGLTIVADGNYLSIAGETGVMGLVLVAGALIGVLLLLVRGLQWRYPRPWIAVGLMGYLCGTCAHAIGANPFEYYWTFPVFWMLLGLYLEGRHNSLSVPAQKLLAAKENP